MVRTDDDRAQSLRELGAEVLVGDLLDPYDVTRAVAGCRRVYFSMSLNPYYVDAAILLAAALQRSGDTEALVAMSNFEQHFMQLDDLAVPAAERQQRLGGLSPDWSPQDRSHWATEQALNWSGLPVVHVRASIFVENPIFSSLPLHDVVTEGKLRLPIGAANVAMIAAADVAAFCANVLSFPLTRVRRSYTITGSENTDMTALAADYAAILGRPVEYEPVELEKWCTRYLLPRQPIIGEHVTDHLKKLAQLLAGAKFDKLSDAELVDIIERPATTNRDALKRCIRTRTTG